MSSQKNIAKEIMDALEESGDSTRKEILQQFFKTGKGEYGEGDEFIGVKVPEQRRIARAYFKDATFDDIRILLDSNIHEHRLTAAIILTLKFEKLKSLERQREIVDFYLMNKRYINNWDIVDSSTHKILGPYIAATRNWDILFQLAQEESIWSKRMAIVALMHLWKKGFVEEGLRLISMNLRHSHDLMHKANGWMLRELGKVNEDAMLQFLEKNYEKLPRTTLRYAIERLDKKRRNAILKEGRF